MTEQSGSVDKLPKEMAFRSIAAALSVICPPHLSSFRPS